MLISNTEIPTVFRMTGFESIWREVMKHTVFAFALAFTALVGCSNGDNAQTAETTGSDEKHTEAKGIDFFHGSFEEALVKAEAEDKLVFVDAYTTWCGPCRMMVLNVFPLEEVGEFYNANFINIKLDTEDEDQNGPELADRYEVSVLPTYLYINPDGTVQHQAVGFIEAELFIGEGKEALGEESKIFAVFAELDKRYQAGERDPAFVQEYLAVARSAAPGGDNAMAPELMEHQAKTGPIFEAYMASKAKSELINSKDFALMDAYLHNSGRDNEYVDFVANNYDAFTKVAPENQVAFFLLEEVKSSVAATARKGDAGYVKYIEELDGLLAPAYKMQLEVIKNDYVYREYLEKLGKIHYEQATKVWDWDQMLADIDVEIAAKAEKGEALTANDYTSFARDFGACDDPEILNKVVVYAKKGYEMEPSTTTAMNYLGFLQKLNQTAKAIEVAEHTLASLDKDDPQSAFMVAPLNQMLETLKAK